MTQKVAEMTYSKEAVEEIKYSGDGTKLAAGSHDNFIDIYDVTRGYVRACMRACVAVLVRDGGGAV